MKVGQAGSSCHDALNQVGILCWVQTSSSKLYRSRMIWKEDWMMLRFDQQINTLCQNGCVTEVKKSKNITDSSWKNSLSVKARMGLTERSSTSHPGDSQRANALAQPIVQRAISEVKPWLWTASRIKAIAQRRTSLSNVSLSKKSSKVIAWINEGQDPKRIMIFSKDQLFESSD